ncbi:hypothetical protein [Escherichia coli]|uniref:hypothetical protein n=1 Tax=Escherichia coli TaxID=562 RepID=UPI00388DE83C
MAVHCGSPTSGCFICCHKLGADIGSVIAPRFAGWADGITDRWAHFSLNFWGNDRP